MRRNICCLLPRLFVTVVSMLGIVLLVGASPMGLDPSPGWGKHKIAFLLVCVAGLVLAQGPTLVRFVRARLGHPVAQVGGEALPRPHLLPVQPEQRRIPVGMRAALAGLFITIEVLYIWFVSVGYWSNWPKTTTYYDMLADAFLHGSTALLVEPDNRLAELANPYPYEMRQNIPVIWDASYYQGKYYLYWGALPAMAMAAVKMVKPQEIGDQVVVFISVSALFLFTFLTLLRFWQTFYASLPRVLLFPGLALAGLAHPLLWVLNRPAIHEAAIATGAAFLMAGVYFAFPILSQGRLSGRNLALASLCWGLALASRLTLIGAVGCLFLAVIIRLMPSVRQLQARKILPHAFALLLPVLMIGLLLVGYNALRFGNPLESGWKYVLSGRIEDHNDVTQVFNLWYVLPNLINYLVTPVHTLNVFPYIKPIWGRASLAPLPYPLPSMYYAEQIAGLLITTPLILGAVFLVWWLICRNAACAAPVQALPSQAAEAEKNLAFSAGALTLAALTGFAPIVLFFSASTRYLLDIGALLTLLICNGAWLAYVHYQNQVIKQRLVAGMILVGSAFSVTVAFLLAITGFEARFEHINPALFDWLTRFFTP